MIREEKLVNESREKYERCDVIIKEVVEVEIGGGRLIERTGKHERFVRGSSHSC